MASKTRSPSSRRAWIEIGSGGQGPRSEAVALLAEGVDRNLFGHPVGDGMLLSPSSRRAWIEITAFVVSIILKTVALLAEGVDRNIADQNEALEVVGRPPRGGRG